MSNHYDTLGIKPDATPAEIKRARRRRAEKLHPDKGGSHEQMSEVNHAFDVLSDPQRRLLYDHTGEDNQQSQDSLTRALIMMVFSNAIQQDAPDALDFARRSIKDGLSKLTQQRKQTTAQRDKLLKRRDKITVKSGLNAFHCIIDQQLQPGEQILAKVEQEEQTAKAALKELDVYETTEKAEQRPVMTFALADMMTGGQYR